MRRMDAASTVDWLEALGVALCLVVVALGLGMLVLIRYCIELNGRMIRMTHLIAEHAVVLAALNGGEEHPYVAKLREHGVLGDVAVAPEQAEDLGPV